MSYAVEPHGFSLVPEIVSSAQRAGLIELLGPVTGAGRRGLLKIEEIAELARSTQMLELVRPHLPEAPRPVRAIYFDKSPEANWLVAWHQDLTIAVNDRLETPGFESWSIKEGVPHVQPPVPLLEQMLTVRLHLDEADADNGALRVIPGSHRGGRLSPTQILEMRARTPEVLCAAGGGDALLMRPLLLHASGRSITPRHRRVLHLEYAAFALPRGLQWHEAA